MPPAAADGFPCAAELLYGLGLQASACWRPGSALLGVWLADAAGRCLNCAAAHWGGLHHLLPAGVWPICVHLMVRVWRLACRCGGPQLPPRSLPPCGRCPLWRPRFVDIRFLRVDINLSSP